MSSIAGILKNKVTKFVTQFYDPLVELKVGNQTIKTPLSHQLRKNVVIYPDYNFNLPRIIKYASGFVRDIKIIDIGANIGDTVAFIKNSSDAPILCIDGDEKYLRLLKENVSVYNNISICHALVGSETKESNIKLVTERGTAYVTESTEVIKTRSLQNILEEFSDFKDSKVLKVDTDGYDTLILRGCQGYLEKVKPILFFEFDPFLITNNNDNPFDFILYLKACGYRYLMFYVNTGDFLFSCDIEQKEIISQVIHYFSGRKIDSFADICAFSEADQNIYEFSVKEEIAHFKKARNY